MIRKSTLMALAATAALGLAILTPNMADARGHGGGHGGGHGARGHHGGHHGMHRGHRGRHFGHHRHRGHRHHRWHRHRHVRWHRPFWYAAPVTYAAPVAGSCTCLTKEYTPEGSVLFKDLCTNEAAINPPVMAPAPAAALQAPQAAYVPQYPQPAAQ